MASLSIVIPTLYEQKYVGGLLRSLEQQVFAPEFEVIVVDASDDGLTREAVEEHCRDLDLTYVHSSVKDIGTQRNLGVSHATYEVLLFLDADVTLSPTVLHECSRSPRDRLFVGAILHRADVETVAVRVGLVLVYLLVLVARIFGMGVTNGDFLLTNRKTFDRIGGFKEGYLLGEDTDFGIRARRQGARYRFIWRTHIVASSRRLRTMSTFALVSIWSRAFIRALLRGPTPRTGGLRYPFGEWR